MTNLTYNQILQKFLDYMKKNGHEIIESSSLVPENDPSLLFTNAGMSPLVPYLLGEKHPRGTKIADVQRCIRTIDIDEVGDNHHSTAFNMLGNWSLNDYFKDTAINLTVKFLVETLEVEIDKLYASVFEGDNDAPKDDISINVWKKIYKDYGVTANVGKGERIQLFGKDKCWWELAGGGPCGPCSEIFYDTGKDACGPNCNVNCDCGKYLELGNNVFMEFLKKDSKYTALGRHNVDFGGGLERWAMISQGVKSFYETDIYKPILNKVKELSKENNSESERVIVDHIKSATWIIMDGIEPSNTEQGYVLRRIIRRAIRHGRLLGIDENFTRIIGDISINQFEEVYPNLKENKERILDVLEKEETNFRTTLQKGLNEFETLIANQDSISGKDAFHLYETYGFPIEITEEMAAEKGLNIDKDSYDQAYKMHQKKSREAAKGFFKGGLADTSEMSQRYHTATHLLLASLKGILGPETEQKGSNINPERLRFDFNSDRKLTPDEIKEIEQKINNHIQESFEVSVKEYPKEEALKLVPDASFAERYGDLVTVYTIGNEENPVSREICRGPHVKNTSELGTFKIIKQENVGAGIKRIKAVLK